MTGHWRRCVGLVFGADSKSLFYVRNEPKRFVPIRSGDIGSAAIRRMMSLSMRRKNPTFSVEIDLSKSRKFMLLNIEGEHTSEVRYLASDRPAGELKIIEPRRQRRDLRDRSCRRTILHPD